MMHPGEEGSLRASMPLAPVLDAIASGALDLHRVIDDACDRLEAIDPEVHAFLPEAGRRARLHADADRLVSTFADGGQLPPLYGALTGVKDIIHVDGFVTHAGSAVPAEAIAGAVSEVVGRLRGAGALILGKTVTTEFAYFEPGPTRNPHNLAHTPGGSSSGSAAAVAAGLAPLALGTQTIGSVIRPAAFCGVVGFKPTLGRIPTTGIVYFSPTIDHIGLFTQDLAGMRRAAAALCSGWQALGPAIELPTLGIPDGPYLAQADEGSRLLLDAFVARAAARGMRVRRVPLFDEIEAINQWHRRLVFGEFARYHASIYERYASHYRPRTAEIIAIGRGVSDAELADLRGRCLGLRAQVEAVMQQEGIDVWVSPAAPGPAPAGLQATGDPNMNLPWTTTGMPALTLPAGRAQNGLPLGLQFAARFAADEALMAWADHLRRELGAYG